MEGQYDFAVDKALHMTLQCKSLCLFIYLNQCVSNCKVDQGENLLLLLLLFLLHRGVFTLTSFVSHCRKKCAITCQKSSRYSVCLNLEASLYTKAEENGFVEGMNLDAWKDLLFSSFKTFQNFKYGCRMKDSSFQHQNWFVNL